jgi:hypothetical protein
VTAHTGDEKNMRLSLPVPGGVGGLAQGDPKHSDRRAKEITMAVVASDPHSRRRRSAPRRASGRRATRTSADHALPVGTPPPNPTVKISRRMLPFG